MTTKYKKDVDKRKLYRKVAKKYGLFMQDIEEIVESQFSFLAETIKKGEFDQVRLDYLGRFHVLPGRIKHLEEKDKRNKLKEEKLKSSGSTRKSR